MHAAAKADDARVAAGQAERDRIMLAARKREVQTAVGQRDQAKDQAAQAPSRRRRLQAELDALKAKPTPRGLVLTLGDVMFDTGRSELKSGGMRKIDQLAQFLTEHPERRVEIDGFTDSVGSDSYNDELSQRRADAVKAALISRNVDPGRISTQGFGKGFPVASNNDSGGRQLNRRVEVVIGGDGGADIAPRRLKSTEPRRQRRGSLRRFRPTAFLPGECVRSPRCRPGFGLRTSHVPPKPAMRWRIEAKPCEVLVGSRALGCPCRHR